MVALFPATAVQQNARSKLVGPVAGPSLRPRMFVTRAAETARLRALKSAMMDLLLLAMDAVRGAESRPAGIALTKLVLVYVALLVEMVPGYQFAKRAMTEIRLMATAATVPAVWNRPPSVQDLRAA